MLIEHWLPGRRIDEIKYRLWKDHGIELPAGDRYVDDAVCFADGVRRLLEAVCKRTSAGAEEGPRRVLAHFHEWLGGLAVPMLRHDRTPVASVFTTHATLLGRYMASNDEAFYDTLKTKDQAAEAHRYNIRPQHAIERACAHGAHVFTTVSPITAEECTQLLGRTPEHCLPNGLNIEQYNVGHEFQTLHAKYKERIHRFVMGHFFPSYSFDLEKTVYLFTSGRFEPRNKGFDLTLEAMARLNAQLKAANIGTTVVLFIVTSRPTRSILPSVLHSRGVLNELQNVCDHIMEDVGHKLFPLAAAGERVDIDDLVDSYWALRYRRTQQALRTKALPPIVTHVIEDEGRDPLLNYLRTLQLFNRKEDPVKVVYHPEFITSTNPLWGLEYEQFVRGCHMGVFPSAYEPWGYTPLECVAMGVPAITSDLAGFGRHITEYFPASERWGLTVLKRRGRSYHDSAAELAKVLMHFCRMDRRARINLRNQVERRSWEFDWSKLGRAYNDAHDMALTRFLAEHKA
jgi:glycogen(starch) synthase